MKNCDFMAGFDQFGNHISTDKPGCSMVRCGHCGCSLVGEVKKGRYVYYHCTGYRGRCGEPYTREEVLEEQFATRLRDLIVPPTVLQWLQSELIESDRTGQAARAEGLRRQQKDEERLEARLDVLYEDRLDGRIDTATYDKKASDIREQLQQIRRRIHNTKVIAYPAVSEAVDLMALTSRAADLFLEQDGAEQRRLLRLVLQEASWKGGELRMYLREPFENLMLSNRVSHTNSRELNAAEPNFDNWRTWGDSN